MARPARDGRVGLGQTAAELERNEEHPLEEGDSRSAGRHAGHLGQSDFPVHRGAGRRRPAAAHAPQGRSTAAHKFVVMALNRKDGRVAWERVAKEEAPHEGAHQEWGTWASPSVATDGMHVIASFESRGIYAFDMKGTPVWQKDLGDKAMRNQFGEGSTPALHGNTLAVVWDHQGQSFIVALDKRTGEERWRAVRDEIDSWATPLVVDVNGRAQVVTAGMKQVRAYDFEKGTAALARRRPTMNPIPSPVAGDGLVFLTAGFRGNNLKAVRIADAKDDITARRRWCGRWIAIRHTCRRRCSTTASCIC